VDDEFKNRLGSFLIEYVVITDDRYNYSDEKAIRQAIKLLITSGAIKLLITSGVFDIAEMRGEALKYYDIIIPVDFITKCLI
jgi:hypothetical protein